MSFVFVNKNHLLQTTKKICNNEGVEIKGINMHLGARIKNLRKARGLTQKQLADKANIKQQALSAIERKGKTSMDTLIKIAQILDTSPAALQYGSENAFKLSKSRLEFVAIPFLSMEQLREWIDTGKLPKEPETIFTIKMLKDACPNAVAFCISTEAMESNHPRSVRAGDTAIVDPDKPLINYCLVAVVINNDVSVRLYKHEEGRQFLIAYNPEYPTITVTSKIKIIGPVIETSRVHYPFQAA